MLAEVVAARTEERRRLILGDVEGALEGVDPEGNGPSGTLRLKAREAGF